MKTATFSLIVIFPAGTLIFINIRNSTRQKGSPKPRDSIPILISDWAVCLIKLLAEIGQYVLGIYTKENKVLYDSGTKVN